MLFSDRSQAAIVAWPGRGFLSIRLALFDALVTDISFQSPVDRPRLSPAPFNTTFDYFATARGRIGYALGPVLPYVTAGAAWGRRLGETAKGTLGLVVMVAVDIFIDGLVLGIGFAAGAKQGFLLTVALTTEVLFLGLSLTGELSEAIRQRAKVLAVIAGLAALLPIGSAVGIPVNITGVLSDAAHGIVSFVHWRRILEV